MKTNYLLIFFCAINIQLFAQSTIKIWPTAQEGKDAVISSRFPSQNYSSTKDFGPLTWTNGGNLVTHRSFIRFDLSSVLNSQSIDSAILRLNHNPESLNTDAEHKGMDEDNSFIVYQVVEGWEESTITWDNQPNITNVNAVKGPIPSSPTEDFEINVTSIVKGMINNPQENHGFTMRLSTEEVYRSIILASSDADDDSLRPSLTLYMSSVGLNEETQEAILVYPNPASDELNFSLKEASQVQLIDLNGKVTLDLNLSEGAHSLNVSALSSGTYQFVLIDAKGVNRKMIQVK